MLAKRGVVSDAARRKKKLLMTKGAVARVRRAAAGKDGMIALWR
jgi:hypothetical protein